MCAYVFLLLSMETHMPLILKHWKVIVSEIIFALGAQAYMNECNDRGIRPYWDCSPDNIGSIRLAQGAGLSLDFNYQVYWYSISECMR